jgi:N-acetylglutamate synthase/N-acetylornithine aminotransferase
VLVACASLFSADTTLLGCSAFLKKAFCTNPQVTIGGKQVHIGGMCKGSGMIHPNMATMLGVVTCDADVEPEVWRGMLRRACDASFNAVSLNCKCMRVGAAHSSASRGVMLSCCSSKQRRGTLVKLKCLEASHRGDHARCGDV